MEDKTLLFDRTIKKIEFLFRFAGINIRSENEVAQFINPLIIFFIDILWLDADLAGGVYWFIDGVRTGKDFFGLTYIAPCISLSTLANFKGLLFVLNYKHIHTLIEKLRDMEKKEKDREFSKEREDIMNKEVDFLNLVINLLVTLYIIVMITFGVSPLVVMWLKYSSSKELEMMLPFLILYPFDPFQIKVWPFVYCHQIWSECVVSLFILSADCFFFTCCTYIRMQFKLLQHSISSLIPTQRGNSIMLDDHEFKVKFKELIQWHEDLIESVHILDLIYSKSTLFNFMTSSTIICLTGFNVTVADDMAFVVIFLCFLFMSLFQVFFICFFADLLMASSMEITDAVYKTKWYMAEAKVGKKLLIMQTRGQKPCKLTAFGFADVNLNSFMRVLSTAWSYFALLQTVYGN